MLRILTALSFITLALAGCAEESAPGPTPELDKESFEFAAGTGAIAGLLVDDRFRPIQLTDDPQTEFQTTGFVLLQETGEQVLTTENGEFNFLDLDPGTYTIRVTADGHEAVPVKVTVKEGVFSEASVVARRVISSIGTIITQDYALFIPCAAYAVFDCTGDQSGDSWRPGLYFPEGFTRLGNFSYSVWEIALNQAGIYCWEVRSDGAAGTSGDEHYGNWCTEPDEDHIHGILKAGEIYQQDWEDPWDQTVPQEAILFYFGKSDVPCWHEATDRNDKRCVGVGFGIKANILLSLFVGEPEVDIDAYCVLC